MDSLAEITAFNRVYLAAFFTFVAAFYTVRIIYMKRVLKRELVFPGAPFCSTWWNHMMFRFFRALIWMVCLLRAFFPSLDSGLGLIAPLQQPLVILTGDVLLTLGFAFTIGVHFVLGAGWRSGVDPAGPVQLKTTGIYGRSRHPMFMGVAVAQLGFFLALPSVFTLVCLGIGWVMLYRQALSEEQYLMQRFPDAYGRYAAQVPRWL